MALALYSGLTDKPIGEGILAIGEIGLAGEIRTVQSIELRIREGQRLGFSHCIVPKHALSSLSKKGGYEINIIGVSNLKQAFAALAKLQNEQSK